MCNREVHGDAAGSPLTHHRADLIGQDGVGVVEPAAATQALLEAVEGGLVGEQYHQDPQGCRHRAGVEVLLHEHQEPIEAHGPHQLITRSAGGDREQVGGEPWVFRGQNFQVKPT